MDNSKQLTIQNSALAEIEVIEQKCGTAPVAFLKSNYDNIKIRDRKSDPSTATVLAITWGKICGLAGIKSEIDDFVAEDISNMIFSAYADLTIEEIHKAFELERYGQFGDKIEHFQLFNAEYIAQVLKKYKGWKIEQKRIHNISKPLNALPEITESQKEAIMISGVERAYREFLNTKTLAEPTSHIFDFLVEKRKIKNGNNPKLLEYYQSKLQEAKAQLQREQSIKTSEHEPERRQIKIELEEIIAGTSSKILIRAKRNILLEYFNKQQQENKQVIF